MNLHRTEIGRAKSGIAVFICVLISFFWPTGKINAQPPDGFQIREIVSLPFSIGNMEILNETNEIIVADLGLGDTDDSISGIWRVSGNQLIRPQLLTLSTNNASDSGIMGMVLDPNFRDNRYFYVFYAPGINALNYRGESSIRISRFTYSLPVVDPESELILIDDIEWAPGHIGGGMAFDNQGYLYIAVGFCIPGYAQDLTKKNGKILRILPVESGYSVPETNPYLDYSSIPDEIYAIGVREPFRMAERYGGRSLYFVDVGDWHWEEVNMVLRGVNYGYSHREGPCPAGEFLPCKPMQDQYLDPIYAYTHPPVGPSAITALTFYEGLLFPSEYQNKLFIADYSRGIIAVVDVDNRVQNVEYDNLSFFDEDAGAILDMEYYNQRLFILDAAGTISVIEYVN